MKDAVVLVTGANRGLGAALVAASLESGAKRVYAGARDTTKLEQLIARGEGRVVGLALDVTDAASLRAAAAQANDVSMLFNNAGVLGSYGVLAASDADLARDFAVNAFGMLATSKAFLPALERAAKAEPKRSALVNVLSVVSLASMPSLGGYSASKAAAHSLTQALRSELDGRGIDVHAVFAGPIDTDMIRHMEGAKTSALDVARATVRAVEEGRLDIFPEAVSQGMHDVWKRDPTELQRQLAAMGG